MNRSTPHRLHRPALAIAAGLAIAVFSTAHAHPGGLAADGCHKHKAAGERHWHADECVKHDGQTVKVAPPEVRIAELEGLLSAATADFEAAETRIAILEAPLAAANTETARAEAAASDASARIAAVTAQAELDVASAEAAAAAERAVARDAQARAAGHGPRVDQRCQTAVRAVAHGDPDWLGDV